MSGRMGTLRYSSPNFLFVSGSGSSNEFQHIRHRDPKTSDQYLGQMRIRRLVLPFDEKTFFRLIHLHLYKRFHRLGFLLGKEAQPYLVVPVLVGAEISRQKAARRLRASGRAGGLRIYRRRRPRSRQRRCAEIPAARGACRRGPSTTRWRWSRLWMAARREGRGRGRPGSSCFGLMACPRPR